MKLMIGIDFDDTVADSSHRLGELYAEEFNCEHPGEVTTWDGGDLFHLAPEGWVEDAFNQRKFFDNLKVKDGVFDILSQIDRDRFQLVLCSLGKPINIQAKLDYVEQTGLFKLFDDVVFTVKYCNDCTPGKTFLKEFSVMVDDHKKNLTHAKYPVLFNDGKSKKWNEGYHGVRLKKWDDYALKLLDLFYEHAMCSRKGK